MLVGGTSSENIDYFDSVIDPAPYVIAFVLLLTFLFLTVVFRSVVIAATAVGSEPALGRGGVRAARARVPARRRAPICSGSRTSDRIEAWVPLFLFSVLFGLSMDYQVFLLSRIRERFDETRDTADAVIFGVGSTARIITGAALIIVAVFSGFARGDLIMFQQMGFGVAVALLIDATIIRSVVLPSAMRLLGDWNWYLPRWLEWLPRLERRGRRAGPEPAASARARRRAERELARIAGGGASLAPGSRRRGRWYGRRVPRGPPLRAAGCARLPRYAGVKTFARCPLVDDPADVDVAVLGIPFDTATTNRPGARFGPEAVRSASIALRPYNPAQEDAGVRPPLGRGPRRRAGDARATPRRPSVRSRTTSSRSSRSGARTLCVGGDHLVVLGELRALAAVHGPVGVVLLDAHADVWDDVLRRALLPRLTVPRALEEGVIDPARSLLAGMRGGLYGPEDASDARRSSASRSSRATSSSRSTPEAYAARVRARVGDGPLFLSFDVDVLDPAFAPGTGTPEARWPDDARGARLRPRASRRSASRATTSSRSARPTTGRAQPTAVAAANVAFELLTLDVLAHLNGDS